MVFAKRTTGCLVEGHFLMGTMAFYRGDFLAARTHLEQSWRLSDTVPSPTATLRGGFVRGVTPRTSLARVLWALGYADQAQQRSQEALALARQVEHPPSLVYAEIYTTLLAQFCRDVTTTHARAEAAGMAVATAQGFGSSRAGRGVSSGGGPWPCRVRRPQASRTSNKDSRCTTTRAPSCLSPYFLALLAEAYGQAGQPEVGLQVLAEAGTLMAATEERWWEAERYRLQGNSCWHRQANRQQGQGTRVGEAEACFRQALEVAHLQHARSLELRAAMSLSRLWPQQGKRAEAYELLAPIYGWFTEGFDTADLQEAKALLEELT